MSRWGRQHHGVDISHDLDVMLRVKQVIILRLGLQLCSRLVVDCREYPRKETGWFVRRKIDSLIVSEVEHPLSSRGDAQYQQCGLYNAATGFEAEAQGSTRW